MLLKQGHELAIAVECTALTIAKLGPFDVEGSLVAEVEDRYFIHEF